MITIGIDPGKTGAVAVHFDDLPKQYLIHDTPEFPAGMSVLIEEIILGHRQYHAYVEKVHAMPGQGVVSMFTFGQNYGTWLGILSAFEVPYTLVAPQTWKKAMLADLPKEKGSAVTRVLQLFPHISDSFKRKKDHNRADAVLIAEYGRRFLQKA